jgi:hypothetical protein
MTWLCHATCSCINRAIRDERGARGGDWSGAGRICLPSLACRGRERPGRLPSVYSVSEFCLSYRYRMGRPSLSKCSTSIFLFRILRYMFTHARPPDSRTRTSVLEHVHGPVAPARAVPCPRYAIRYTTVPCIV